ncbi:efflux RND transporter permease subunit [Halothiobacillus neapolitanus]|uniref:Heavy metal efflux pump, CzcA family n=1 Tax=Halothiobacillus neapolitanus (strain ATCC 23641 / DSM 15147 / CIP 104769 / NCIMB 8539 / c2) TaxID=555778 RepID=D0KWS0_HALNC|nr:CusA/CzcA family heavy metal efflux RND transporter [Halothiobacillus neapolitanus]ACX95067.1 heavy metal efflux pump, CzcA family [Halothiobacillus neapolitanus c2]TDN60979.1 cobalt-zinc-cadmium resistance protein CzcA [Halothiobacillus neapolitanus]
MLNRLIAFSLAQRLMVLLAAILVAGFGWMAFSTIPIDAYPDISPTQVQIILKAPGVTPTEVETRITAPLETSLLGIPNQTMLRSTSKYGISVITLDFAEGTDIYWARQQVNEALSSARGDLPAGTTGGVAPITTPLGEAFMFTLQSPTLSLTERRHLLDWVIRPALRAVKGVADVNSLGGFVRTFEVIPNPTQLAAQKLTTDDLMRVIEQNNRNDGAGRLDVGEEAWLVRSEGRIKTLDDLGNLVIAQHNGQPIHVRDVATVRIGAITRLGAVTHSGKGETVEGLVLTLRGANARAVVAGVEQRLAEIKPSLPPDLKINVFYNRADLVNAAVHTVSKALLEAVVLVLILLILFLGNLRAAVTVALTLPMAALITFILMKQFGMSANLMSLGGLAIAIGMLVDAAVVVVENTVAHLAEAHKHPNLPRLHIVYRSVREVAAPVFSGILIIMLVFLPLLSLQGLEGKLFSPVALTIIFALGASLVLSLTLIPVIASLILGKVTDHEPWLVRQLHRIYEPALNFALKRPLPVVAVAIAGLVVAGLLYTQIGKTFMPSLDEGTIVMQVENLPSTNLGTTIALNTNIQKTLMAKVPEIAQIVGRSGSDELGLDPMGLNDTDTFIILKPKDQWQASSIDEVREKIRAVISTLPGFNFSFTQPIEMRVSEMLTGSRGDLAIKIFGSDLTEINTLSNEIKSVVSAIPGAQDVATTDNEGLLYLNIAVNQAAAARNGLSVNQLEDILRAQIEGQLAGIVQEGVARTPILIRADALTDAPQKLSSLPIALPNGTVQPLSNLAIVERTTGPVFVTREMGSRFAVVRANVSGRALTDFVADAKNQIAEKVEMPTGYRLEWGGQFENQQRAAARLAIVVPIALGLIFVLLFTTFNSVRQATLVFANIPFALIGGVVALYISGEYLSVPASVGFIALLGIAVLNGLVLVSYFNQLAAQGLDIEQVVRQGALRRLRPVMMTASIAALGLVPLLFATGPGSEIQRPLAVVVIGGLVTSTLLTLILLPILYKRFGQSSDQRRAQQPLPEAKA